jgi:flavin reductase (DIM6/NTAB) family NADH-FMN oxidoreductase RutF
MRRIAIVGAGQSGLQLALGLLGSGYEVTLVSNRTPDEIATGRVTSSQCMFDDALQTERDLVLHEWEARCPSITDIELTLHGAKGADETRWKAPLDQPAQSVDQRLKVPSWMDHFEREGGRLVINEATLVGLDSLSREHDLVIVAAGKGEIASLFPRDPDKSPFHKPQRALALAYVRSPGRHETPTTLTFHLLPGIGEYFVFPALTISGPCEIMVFEGVPGGPMDCWNANASADEHLATCRNVLRRFLPEEAERLKDCVLTDTNGFLVGRLTPVVRRPIGTLPSGAKVLGMADALVLNDPITGQGSNNAAKCAAIYLQSIIELGQNEVTLSWMQTTFDRYWRGYAQWVVQWTNSLLGVIPEHVASLLRKASEVPSIAAAIANGFDDPRTFYPWWFDPVAAERFIDLKVTEGLTDRFDRRDLRTALGQFATGVTVVTTCGADGRPIGVTVNSFASLSLSPPLVLWSLSKLAPSLPDFCSARYFAINVLAHDQHHLSRQFSTPQANRFNGLQCAKGIGGVPLLPGVIAQFECQNLRQYDGGDHTIFCGAIERYQRYDKEPLVFHSGRYRVATRHPDFADE